MSAAHTIETLVPGPAPQLRVLEGRAAEPTLADQALVALAVHRMLTLDQLREMLTPASRATTNWSTRLNDLARSGLVRALPRRGFGPKIWCCTRDGLRQAATTPGQRRRPYEVPETGGMLAPHTLAVNEIGLAFVRAARERGDDCNWLSWDHEVAHSLGPGRSRPALIVDALMTYDQHGTPAGGGAGQLWRWFLEMDRATEPLPKLLAKLRTYATYRAWIPTHPETYGVAPNQPAWRAWYQHWPITCVVIGANRDKNRPAINRRIDQLLDLAADDPLLAGTPALPALVCNFDDLVTSGPWEPIWWRLDRPDTPVDAAGQAPKDPKVP